MAVHMKMILLSLVMLLIAFEPAFSGKILKKLDKELKKMGLQKLQNFLADIGTNADEIDSNKAHFDNIAVGLAVDIANNTVDIATNADEIESNKAHFDNIAVGLAVDIATNADEIDSNKVHIDNNAVDIDTLKTNGSGSVWFDAWSTTGIYTSYAWIPITYNNVEESSSYSGAMDIGTGMFTAPLAGTYQFTIQGYKPPGDDGEVMIKLDGNTINRIVDFNKGIGFTISGSSIITMESGQKVWAKTWTKLYSYPNGINTHFTGVLITSPSSPGGL